MPRNSRRLFNATLVTLAAALPALVQAQSSGDKPANYPGDSRVSIVVPFAPGGATDIIH